MKWLYMLLSPKKVCELINHAGFDVSIDKPFRHDAEHTLLDILHDGLTSDDSMMYQSIKEKIEHSFKKLNKRDRQLLIMFFGLGPYSPLSLEEISKKINITIEHARMLKENA
jgi:RNA polymerase primary sigma factor